MVNFRKKLIKSEREHTNSGILAKFSFSGKFSLALFLLAVGLLAQCILVLSCFFEYRNDLAQITLSRRTNDGFIKDLHNLSQDLLEKTNIIRNSEIPVELSDEIFQITQTLNHLREFNENISLGPINRIDAIIKQYREIAPPLTRVKTQTIRNLSNQYTEAVNELEIILEKEYQRHNQENLLIALIKFIAVLLVLFLGVFVCKGLIKRALRSVTDPASRIVQFLHGANGDLQVKLPTFAKDGLGTTGLILNEAISKWWAQAVELKNASNKLNYLIEDLTSDFNQVFLLEVQLQEAYREIESSLNGQKQMGRKVNDEIETIIANLSGLQYLPGKVCQISEELNSLLTVNKEYLNGVDRQVEINNESHDIIDFLKDLAATSKRVDRIMKELGEIEEESEMLAFNSAISAARAGEEGQGFSVVAKEIANLVERSKKASNNLSDLIGQIQAQTEQIVGLIPENNLKENGKLSLDHTINSICSTISATAAKCLTELEQMRQVVETIYTQNNETFEEINTTSDLPQVETGALLQIKNSIERYLESIKYTEEITNKIVNTVSSLQLATDSLINRNV